MSWTHVSLHDRDRVAVVAMRRTKGGNALSREVCDDLVAGLTDAVASGARAVVLLSEADHFCVGADLRERSTLDDDGLLEAREHSNALTAALLGCPVPLVVAVHGFTLGGGLEIALTADVVVADSSAVLGLPEVGIGIVPGGGGTQLLSRRVGWGTASSMIYTGRRVTADDALRVGLVDEVVAVGRSGAAAIELASLIAANNPQSLRLVKHAMTSGQGRPQAEALAIEDAAWQRAALSDDYRQGLAAFAERTAPPWA
ncbi:MAG: hypothetical protein QOH68_4286 [Nocardioidaceae bacterium]|jgi:enoyl-CoA hydratase/carnithine racemase|nr:hypothetical protein [Nocardioidaceae bacterium]